MAGNGLDIAYGGFGNDDINLNNGLNTAAGDNATATFNSAGQILSLTSISPADGGNDTIVTGIDADLVFGGVGDDNINVSDGTNVVAGDNATATIDAAGQLRTVQTTHVINGGQDTILSGMHNYLIIAGTAADHVTSGAGADLIFGDNG